MPLLSKCRFVRAKRLSFKKKKIRPNNENKEDRQKDIGHAVTADDEGEIRLRHSLGLASIDEKLYTNLALHIYAGGLCTLGHSGHDLFHPGINTAVGRRVPHMQ